MNTGSMNSRRKLGGARRLVNLTLLVVALLILAEEWLWDHLKGLMLNLGRLPYVRAFEEKLRLLPPWASLLVLLAPALLLFPFKILALWALCNGYKVGGLVVLLAAKVVGTAAAAYLFDLVRDRARQLRWFDRLYVRTTHLLVMCKAWVNRQVAYQVARHKVRQAIRAIRSVLKSNDSRLARKYRAAKVVGRRWRCCLLRN